MPSGKREDIKFGTVEWSCGKTVCDMIRFVFQTDCGGERTRVEET